MNSGPSALSGFKVSLLRRSWMFALACLFVISSTAIQTHLHGVANAPGLGASIAVSNLGHGNDDADADHCLLCQAFMSGGGLLPVIDVVAYLCQLRHLDFHHAAAAAVQAVAHIGWQGRAPPR